MRWVKSNVSSTDSRSHTALFKKVLNMFNIVNTHFTPTDTDFFLKHLYASLPSQQTVQEVSKRSNTVVHKQGATRVPRYPKVLVN